jgi:hypothetical protein
LGWHGAEVDVHFGLFAVLLQVEDAKSQEEVSGAFRVSKIYIYIYIYIYMCVLKEYLTIIIETILLGLAFPQERGSQEVEDGASPGETKYKYTRSSGAGPVVDCPSRSQRPFHGHQRR